MNVSFAVIGLGYVGLPLAIEGGRAGARVVGYDTSEYVVSALNNGNSHVDDFSDEDVAALVDQGFRATSDPDALSTVDVIVICVPTPLSADGGPDLGAVRAATRSAAANMKKGALVVLESTTYPGTTEEIVLPILQAGGLALGKDFNLAFSPERIDPGNLAFGLRNTPKVVGGATAECVRRAAEFYRFLVDDVVIAKGTREAEMAKLLENTYRHVNIALVNEMAKFCHELDIDLWDVIRLAGTKPFGYQPFWPGVGVGGHCIPIDPNYLSHRVKARLGYPFRFVELAQEINQSMPAYVARRATDILNLAGKPVRGSRVVLLGVTYKANIADQRESPAKPLAENLLRMGAELAFFDPHVNVWEVAGRKLESAASVRAATEGSDLVIVVQAHRDFDLDFIADLAVPVLDTRGVIESRSAHFERL